MTATSLTEEQRSAFHFSGIWRELCVALWKEAAQQHIRSRLYFYSSSRCSSEGASCAPMPCQDSSGTAYLSSLVCFSTSLRPHEFVLLELPMSRLQCILQLTHLCMGKRRLQSADKWFFLLHVWLCNYTTKWVLPCMLLLGISHEDDIATEPTASSFLRILCACQKGEKKQSKSRSRVHLSSGGLGKERNSEWQSR